MGSCVSLNKDTESAMKFRLGFRSKNDKLIIPSPVKEKPLELADGAVKSQLSTTPTMMVSRDTGTSLASCNYVFLWGLWSMIFALEMGCLDGSKEEAFFDSQPCLESDCEDDFFSVNGDFTPSRGNTPVHHNFSVGTPQANRSPFVRRTPNSTPGWPQTDKKKKLSELFKESLGGDEDAQEQNAADIQKGFNLKTVTTGQVPPKSANETPFISGANSVCSSQRSPNTVVKPPGEKSLKSAQCCLPRLLSSRSFSERKKRTSPALSVEA